MSWWKLGDGYPPSTDPVDEVHTRAAFDALAPVHPQDHLRYPVYELEGNEPRPEEVWELARAVTKAVLETVDP